MLAYWVKLPKFDVDVMRDLQHANPFYRSLKQIDPFLSLWSGRLLLNESRYRCCLPLSLILALSLLSACDSSSESSFESAARQCGKTQESGAGRSSDGTTPASSEPIRDLPPPVIVGGDTSAISGLWDRSREGDVYYTYIGQNGEFTIYDYDQDADGTGLNCYRRLASEEDRGRVLRPYNTAENLYLLESFYYQLVDEYANIEELRHNSAIYRIEKLTDGSLEFQGMECVMGAELNEFQTLTLKWSPLNNLSLEDLNICVNHPFDF